jgi:hypothetical protein
MTLPEITRLLESLSQSGLVVGKQGSYLCPHRLHTQKRDLANSLLEGTESATRVSADDLLGLLREKDTNRIDWQE